MLDCRNMACPQPVIQAKEKEEAEAPPTIEVLVDNQAASQNVSRFLGTRGYSAEVTRQGDDFVVTGRLGQDGV